MVFEDAEINEFKTEALELLATAEQSLLLSESGADFEKTYGALFRVFHNLKGASGMMGMHELGHLMHEVENTLTQIKANERFTREETDYFLKKIDDARSSLAPGHESSHDKTQPLNSPQAPNEGEDLPGPLVMNQDGLQEFITEGYEITQRLGQTLESVVHTGPSQELIQSLYRDFHTLKGGAFLFNTSELGELTHAIESVLEKIKSTPENFTPLVCSLIYRGIDLVDLSFRYLEGKSPENPAPMIEKAILALRISGTIKEPAAKEGLKMSEDKSGAPQVAVESDKENNGTVRVSVSLLDKLMTLMGEMVLVRNQVIQYSSRNDDLEFLNLSQRLNVITGEIQTEMMKTRMQPIGNVVGKFSRMVRELSKDLGKKIDLHQSGMDTELDKTLLEAVKDPLTHIIRNSCDHGIETGAERLQAGKPETGNIFINSFYEGGQVIIAIKDDGKGLHREKILQKAIQKGILTSEKAKLLTDREIMNLIFAPGFSTAAQVTSVSGRGVGMDVVRTNIEKIGGAVEISSVEGQTTEIRLKIPLTLAIVPAMIVRCKSDYFAIPQLKLVELVRVEQNISEHRIEYIQGHPIFRLRGNILPLVHLTEVLGHKASESKADEVFNIVILKNDHFCFGLIVDEIQDTADIVVKPLARFLKPLGIYSGATVLGDGSIALILDVAGIVKLCIETSTTESQEKLENQSENNRKLDDMQDFLLLKINSPTKHSILLNYVHRLEELRRSDIEISGRQRIVRYRDTVLPLISLNHSLELAESKSEGELFSVVVVEKGGSLYGIEVNEILDVLTVDSELDTTVQTEQGIVGNLVTKDEIIVVVDPYVLIQRSLGQARQVSRPQASVRAEPSIHKSELIKNILYVEDAAFFRRQVSKALSGHGYKVTTANNGKEALDLLAKNSNKSFDLILSDIEMPQMNGFELAVAVRRNASWKNIPMVALSTRADQSHRQKGLESGFDAYLEKLNSEELLEHIAEISRKEAA
jgi:two-component system chemotaxis sensor kinase CheA